MKERLEVIELSSWIANFGVYRVAPSGASVRARRWPGGGLGLAHTPHRARAGGADQGQVRTRLVKPEDSPFNDI